MLAVLANLDAEARWAGVQLPQAIVHRISASGALVAVLAPESDDVEVWAPGVVDAARLHAVPGWTPPRMCVGVPSHVDLAWADPRAKAVNDRRLALALAQAHGVALPGARVIERVDDIAIAGRWVAKAPWTAAGRDRCHGDGAPTPEQHTRLERLLATFGALVLEPWCDRLFDLGVCAVIDDKAVVTAQPPHSLIVDRRGGFVGIDLAPPPLEPAERATLQTMVAVAGDALAGHGYVGPFTIDAFVYQANGRKLHPLCEINARYSFGFVARGFARRCGATQLGFGPTPEGARVLIDDLAWIKT